ncbi:MAG: hypothetical protein AB7K09_17900 [Planctomycetota bacterium]
MNPTRPRSNFPRLTSLLCVVAVFAVLALGVPDTAAAQDSSGRYAPRVSGEAGGQSGDWEWTFPDFVGNVGLGAATFASLPEFNGSIGVFYRHLESCNGPLYMGFRIEPFTMGTVYDDGGYPALYSWSSHAEYTLRLYSDLSFPEFYVEFAAGLQYTRFRTADSLSDITENGFSRQEFGRWRGTVRLSVGLEFDSVGLEFGYTRIVPEITMTYTTYVPSQPTHTESIDGLWYFNVYFRFDS